MEKANNYKALCIRHTFVKRELNFKEELNDAKDTGAILKIDRLVLVELDIFDEYLESFRVK